MVNTPTELTQGHRTVHALLTDARILVEDEKEVGIYTLDMYLPEWHLAVEFDGPLHDKPKQRKHDERRTAWLWDQYLLPVLRFKQEDIATKVAREGVAVAVLSFIDEESELAPTRVEEGVSCSTGWR